jgi:hypothetical protein
MHPGREGATNRDPVASQGGMIRRSERLSNSTASRSCARAFRVTLSFVTGLHGRLLHRLRLLVACLMLALAAVPPCIVLARDTSAASAGTASAPASSKGRRTTAELPKDAARCERRTFRATPPAPRLATTSQELDRRYLYLELVTLLS